MPVAAGLNEMNFFSALMTMLVLNDSGALNNFGNASMLV
jgi:hypothetical protein